MLLSRNLFSTCKGKKNKINAKLYYHNDTGTKLELRIGYRIMVNPSCWVVLSIGSVVINQIYWMVIQIIIAFNRV